MTMRSLTRAFTALALLLLGAALPCAAQQELFSFYGLTFGMVKGAVAKAVPMVDGVVKSPGHGMTAMELVFDREDLLMQIRATWPRPADPLEHQGLVRALRERFVAPLAAKHPSIAVTLDEYSDRASVALVLLDTTVREKNIEHYKDRYLKALE